MKNSEIVQRYVDGVMGGDGASIATGRYVKLAVRRYLDDLQNAESRGYYFSDWHADTALSFYPYCRHSKGSKFAGKPLELEPWQVFIRWNLFGWRRAVDDTRRFRKAFIEVARKNGKSTSTAADGLLLLLCDQPFEPGAEVYVAATKEKQAGIIHGEAVRMRNQSPYISELTKKYHNRIVMPESDGIFAPLGSDSSTNDGWNPSAVLIDELHAWREKAHRGLWERLTTGGGSREQPLTIVITTAGDDTGIIWKEEHDLACRAVEAVELGQPVADNLFSFVAALDPDDDPLDEANWPKANPNLGVSVKLDYLREQAEEARISPAAMNKFRRYHCNLMTTSSERAIDVTVWARAAAKVESLERRKAWGGFDLGRSDDWCGTGLLIEKPEGGLHLKTTQFSCADRAPELRTAEVEGWIKSGELIEHPGDQVDFGQVQAHILELDRTYHVQSWAYDPRFAASIAQALLNDHGLELVEFPQSHLRYNEPLREFIRALNRGEITHDGLACLAWQARNLGIKRNAKDEWMPDKGGERWQKIDSMVAAVMGFGEWLFHSQSGSNFKVGDKVVL